MRLKAYRKHVFSDINPYMCTREVCADGEKSFGSRESWMNHLNSHRALHVEADAGKCPFCSTEFESDITRSFDKHVGYHFEEIRLLSLPAYYRMTDDNGGDEAFDDSSDSDESEGPEGSRGSGLSGIAEETATGEGATRSLEPQLRGFEEASKTDRTDYWLAQHEGGNRQNLKQV